MAFKYQPGMRMYQVVWERGGEELFVSVLHAEDEAGAIAKTEESLAGFPEMDFDRSGTTVHARLYKFCFAEDGN
jgi:hypothetical protein